MAQIIPCKTRLNLIWLWLTVSCSGHVDLIQIRCESDLACFLGDETKMG